MKQTYDRIISLILRASSLARNIGIKNILQPGLVKEMIVANKLNHKLIYSKKDADACDLINPNIKYEYLSCIEGGSGQLDRMFKEPIEKRKKSLARITRNHKIYLIVFYVHNQLEIKNIYEIEPHILLKEAERQLDNSSNAISHIGIPEKWVVNNGKKIFSAKNGKPTPSL